MNPMKQGRQNKDKDPLINTTEDDHTKLSQHEKQISREGGGGDKGGIRLKFEKGVEYV